MTLEWYLTYTHLRNIYIYMYMTCGTHSPLAEGKVGLLYM